MTVEQRARAGALTSSLELALVTGDAPAAVLLVDLRSRRVVYTNPVADQLAPGARLPVALDAWSDLADLRDLDGAELSETDHPLSKVARSVPVVGEAVSAARGSAMGRQRLPLWVVALPMADAPMLEGHALVVFLPLSRREAAQAALDAAQASAQLRDRAVVATGLSFTVADAQDEDVPLVWVNPAFEATTGYAAEEVLGRNCRFLQGPATDPQARAALRRAIEAEEDATVTILNYRKDGTAFWNQVSMSPIHGPDGELTHFVGIQADVTARVAADAERDRALEAERRARVAAERAQQRLDLLVEATSELTGSLDVDECRRRLTRLLVPRLADWAVLVTTDDRGGVAETAALHRDPGRTPDLERWVEGVRETLVPGPVVPLLLGEAHARRISDFDDPRHLDERRTWVRDPDVLPTGDGLGRSSVLLVAVPGRERITDLLVLVRGPESPRHTDEDLEVAVDLARRAGIILDNARLFRAQHRIAETLQHSLLPELPVLDRVAAAARYRASETGAQVGGDFYELIDLPDGSLGVAIGDVVGHDVLAAARMGHLRGLLRAAAWGAGTGSTGDVLERVDQLMSGLGLTTMATLAYGRLDPADDGGWTLTYSSAGHPPFLLRDPSGRVEALDDAQDLLLGVQPRSRRTARHHLAPGSLLLAYTDGLVERRGEHLERGLERLAAALAEGPDDPDGLCDHVLGALGGDGDDIAVLAVRV
ncbi:SpoIIE family protein phosphatase [Cellulomonas endophytica]|uniref:SpoIIE family protein phosphatase n=1 Tax=Cellulomonas endophytica TaxID=2494735 RepID=UPI001011505F|nr:SpoIIE family protein phosphatase [Cellulomonas endophytica]